MIKQVEADNPPSSSEKDDYISDSFPEKIEDIRDIMGTSPKDHGNGYGRKKGDPERDEYKELIEEWDKERKKEEEDDDGLYLAN